MEIETEPVYTDEVDISLGFAEFVRVGITQTACQHSKKTPKDSTLHHIAPQDPPWRQHLLQAAAAAVAGFPPALEAQG